MEARGQARNVLVTGAGSGIGKAIAERLAASGDHVLATVRDPKRADGLAAQAKAAGLDVTYLPLDYEVPGSLEKLAAEVDQRCKLDVLVNNAGCGISGPVEEVSPEQTARLFQVNFFGPLALTRRLLPGVRERKGCVIWIGSFAGKVALPFQAHYSATKAAVSLLSDAMRMELAPLGVRVSCVEPGDFATGFTDARVVLREPGSPYQPRLDACMETVAQGERAAPTPDWVGRLVEKISRDPRPAARYQVGKTMWLYAFLLKLLPDILREGVIRRMYRA